MIEFLKLINTIVHREVGNRSKKIVDISVSNKLIGYKKKVSVDYLVIKMTYHQVTFRFIDKVLMVDIDAKNMKAIKDFLLKPIPEKIIH